MRKLILASDVEKVFDQISQAGFLVEHTQGIFIPTASLNKDYQAFFEKFVRPNFLKQRIHMQLLELSQAKPEEIASKLQQASLLYVGGGNTFLLLEKIRATDLALELDAFFEAGGLYIGSSAGAVVAGLDIAFISCIDQDVHLSLKDFSGLKLVDLNLLPHIDHPQYGPSAKQADLGGRLTIGLRENQYLYVNGSSIEVF